MGGHQVLLRRFGLNHYLLHRLRFVLMCASSSYIYCSLLVKTSRAPLKAAFYARCFSCQAHKFMTFEVQNPIDGTISRSLKHW